MPFHRRHWDEPRGDEYDDWGSATYYFWTVDNRVEQQVEVYDSGVVLVYNRYHREDEYGRLTNVELDEAEWSIFEVDIDTYRRETDVRPFNSRG